jgi:hypothetical protein
VRGRLLDRNDVHEAAVHKVVVSEAFAKRAFPNRDPIGQRIRYSGGDQRPWDEKRAIWSVDKDQPIVRIATMDVRIAATEAQRHFALIVFEAFAFAHRYLRAHHPPGNDTGPRRRVARRRWCRPDESRAHHDALRRERAR